MLLSLSFQEPRHPRWEAECDATFLSGCREDRMQLCKQGPRLCLAPGPTCAGEATDMLPRAQSSCSTGGAGPPVLLPHQALGDTVWKPLTQIPGCQRDQKEH